MAYDELLRRIDVKLSQFGLSERKACLKAALKVDAIRNIRRGRAPRAETLAALAKLFEVPSSYFLDVAGEVSGEPDDGTAPEGYVYVPTLDVHAGLGGGGYSDEDLMGPPRLAAEGLIFGELRGTPQDFVFMEVEGPSMTPVLESGDMVLIDRRQTNPTQPGLFVLWDGYGLVAKWVERVAHSEPPRFKITSENHRFTPYEVLAQEARIIGRVRWFARRM